MLKNLTTIPVTNLATKMLMTRLKLMNWEKSAPNKQAAIDAAYEFFSKNESMVKDDIKVIFG